MKHTETPEPFATLRREAWLVWLAAGAFLVAGGFGLRPAWTIDVMLGWVLFAGPAAAYIAYLLHHHLSLNHPPDATRLYPNLGVANWITLTRGLLIPVLAGLILLPRPAGALAWLPFLLYSGVIWLDLLDGYVARVSGRVTALGVMLDMEYDSFGSLVVSALVVHYGQVPWWYLAWGFARYLFVLGLWWLERWDRPMHSLPPSVSRRIAAGLNFAFASVALMPLFSPPATTVAGVCFLTSLLLGFLRDWLFVSGVLVEDAPVYRVVRRLGAWVERGLPPVLRLGSGLVALAFLLPLLWTPALRAPFLLAGLGVAAAEAAGVLALCGGVGLLLGIVSRFAALALLAATCLDVLARGYQAQHAFLIVALIGILYLGGGALALWSAEDGLFIHRRGVRRRASPPTPLS